MVQNLKENACPHKSTLVMKLCKSKLKETSASIWNSTISRHSLYTLASNKNL
jgi:hypothetical protein